MLSQLDLQAKCSGTQIALVGFLADMTAQMFVKVIRLPECPVTVSAFVCCKDE